MAADTSSPRTSGASTSKGVVITGGTKGLGFALARHFLRHGDRVVICGRDADRLARAVASLQADGAVHGLCCDVARPEEVERLADFARRALGAVDIFVNNAGRASAARRPLWQLPAEDVAETCNVNVLGSMLCCRAAIQLFLSQLETLPEPPRQPRYHLFNFGFSPLGAGLSASTVPHKSTKRGVAELTRFLAAELRTAGLHTAIGVHECSPGLVLTDLLLKPDTPVPLRRFFNTIAEEPMVVAEFLVPRMRDVRSASTEVRFLQFTDAFGKVVGGLPAILWGGRHFDREGRRVGDGTFNEAGVKELY
eukprot:EG_transcript_17543